MLAEIIHKIAGMEKQEWTYKPRPSNAGPERCIRQLVYNASSAPKDKKMGDRFVHILNDGNWHEELTNDWIRKSNYTLHSEQLEVDCGDGLKGHIDGIVTDMLNNDYLYEHKGMNHFTFQRYIKEVYPLDYFTQVAFYLKGLRKLNPEIDKAILLVKNKNTCAFMEFLLQYDAEMDTLRLLSMSFSETGETKYYKDPPAFPNITQSAVDRFKIVDEHVKAKTLPQRPHELGTTFPCTYCQWEKTCWTTYADEVKAICNNEADLTDIADTARFYNELGGQIGDMTKQRKEVGSALKKELANREVREGKAGEYKVELTLVKRTGYTVKEKMTETLRVKKLRPKEKNEQKNI